MNAIGRKLQSRKGASITFALLLFLVCAVVSSVVIVAGTAAAGRMSNMAEADQRYYAVTSAAELLKGELCNGKTAKVTYNRGTGVTQTVYTDASDNLGDETTLMKDTSARVIEAMREKKDIVRRFTLTPETTVADARINCNIVETVQSNGLASFDVSSDDGTGRNVYTLKIVFYSSTKQNALESSATAEVTTVDWKLHSISKGRTAVTGG